MRESKPVQSYYLPAEKNAELITKDQRLIAKAHIVQDKLEKTGRFHVIKGLFPKTEVFIPFGANVQESIENYLKKLERNNNTLRKIKL